MHVMIHRKTRGWTGKKDSHLQLFLFSAKCQQSQTFREVIFEKVNVEFSKAHQAKCIGQFVGKSNGKGADEKHVNTETIKQKFKSTCVFRKRMSDKAGGRK